MGGQGSCPTENELAEYAANPSTSAEITDHLDGCDACRVTVARLAELAFESDPHRTTNLSENAPTSAGRPLHRGACVGRYVVLEVLGVGAMGTVYAAYDPELDRKIALKLLRPELCRGPSAA